MELLVVTAILGLIAYMALDTVAQDTSSVRYDDTRTRLNAIRTAVLGRPATDFSPGIPGFIADMGRVPKCPQELMKAVDCTEDHNPLLASARWKFDIDTDVTPNTGTGLGRGWRGPYLHAFRETKSGSDVALRDGWGNTADGEPIAPATDLELFGWRRFGPDTDGNLIVQSYGSEGVANSTSVATYAAQDMYMHDYPPSATGTNPNALPDPLVAARDYQIALPALVSIQLKNATSAPMNFPAAAHVCASLHYVGDGEIKTVFTTVDPAALPTTFDAGDVAVASINVNAISSAQSWLPAGSLALRLRYVTSATATCDATAPLLQHTYDPVTSPSQRCDLNNLSPGLACGTNIIAAVPPQLPSQINVNLTWSYP
jgi:hypothetical protein